jgi:hypothetical protein
MHEVGEGITAPWRAGIVDYLPFTRLSREVRRVRDNSLKVTITWAHCDYVRFAVSAHGQIGSLVACGLCCVRARWMRGKHHVRAPALRTCLHFSSLTSPRPRLPPR